MKKFLTSLLGILLCFTFLTACTVSEAKEEKNEFLIDEYVLSENEENYVEVVYTTEEEPEVAFETETAFETEGEITTEVVTEIENEIIIEDVTQVVSKDEVDVIDETASEVEEEHTAKYVCITFDDGPHKTNTEAILNLLEEYDAVATFFEVGYLVDTYPDIVKMEYEAGCEVENHTYSHINMSNSSYETILDEISKCSESIYNATGTYPTFVRPPYGNVNTQALSDCNLAASNWSIDTRDWESKDKDKIMQVIYDEGDLSNQVILMHSTHEETVEALEILLPYLKENGYTTVTLKEMFTDVYGQEIVPGTFYGYTFYKTK